MFNEMKGHVNIKIESMPVNEEKFTYEITNTVKVRVRLIVRML